MQPSTAVDYFQMCLQQEDLNEACHLFELALDSAQKYLDNCPDAEDIHDDVVSSVLYWSDAADGLDGMVPIEAYTDVNEAGDELDRRDFLAPLHFLHEIQTAVLIDGQLPALVLCLRGTSAYYAGQQAGATGDDTMGEFLIKHVAVPAFEQALQLKPDYTAAQDKLSEVRATIDRVEAAERSLAHYNQGVDYVAQQRFAEAIREYEAALQIKPDFAEARHNLAVAHLNWATLYGQQGRQDEAIAEVELAAQLGLEPARQLLAKLESSRLVINTAWSLINKSNTVLDFCTAKGNSDNPEKIRRTTEYINKIHSFLTGISQDSLPYEVYKLVEYGLAALYFQRAVWKFVHGRKPKNNEMLKSALQDLSEASQFPDDCYKVAGRDMAVIRSSYQDIKAGINEALGGCFIATAAYGSALAPEVATLRQFRDTRLKPNRAGQLFVRLYERFSPPLANWIAPRRTARVWVQRLVLTPLVWVAKRRTD